MKKLLNETNRNKKANWQLKFQVFNGFSMFFRHLKTQNCKTNYGNKLYYLQSEVTRWGPERQLGLSKVYISQCSFACQY